MKTLEDAYAVFQNPYATYSDMQAAQSFIEANESLAPVRGLIAPEEGYTYGDIVPIRTNQATGQRELTVPMFAREGAQSLLNIAEGSQTGVVNPEDVMNVMPMGGAASLLDEGIEGGFAAGMFIGRVNKRANEDAFAYAEDLAQKGANPRRIWKETGEKFGTPIYLGRDMQLRQEVSDKDIIPLSYFQELIKDVKPNEVRNISTAILGDQFGELKRHGVEGLSAERLDEWQKAFRLRDYSDDLMTPNIKILGEEQANAILKDSLAGYDGTNHVVYLRTRQNGEDVPPALLRSALLHELQHSVQYGDNFPRGAGGKTVRSEAVDSIRSFESSPVFAENAGLLSDAKTYQGIYSDVMKAGLAKQFDDLSKNPRAGRQARQLFNSSEWYRIGDSIVRELGAPPKRSGEARDQWIRDASALMSANYANQVENKGLLDLSRNEIKNAERRVRRKAYPEGTYEANYVNDRSKSYINYIRGLLQKANEDPDSFEAKQARYQLYQLKLGEVEARMTQSREQMNMADRIAQFPEESADVPMNKVYMEPHYQQMTNVGLMGLLRD